MALPSQTRQWLTGQDGLNKLVLKTVSLPEPQADEVLVKIHAVSLNYRDTEVCMGLYGHHKSVNQSKPIVPCSDMCGTVIKAGSKASHTWKEGQRVISLFNEAHQTGQITEKHMAHSLGLPLDGVLAEYRIFPTTGIVAAPDYLSDEEAACLPIAAVTAWMSINWMQPIGHHLTGSDKSVLVLGTGGVSISGLQIAKASGLQAIVTSSSDEKLERARKLGADHVINYRKHPQWHEEVLDATNGEGADVVFENGGAQTLRQSFESVKWGGMISCIGYLSGKEDEATDRTNTNVLALKRNVTLKGMLNGPKDRLEEMLHLYTDKQIHPVIDKTFAFEESKEALEHLFSGSHFGKVVIRVADK